MAYQQERVNFNTKLKWRDLSAEIKTNLAKQMESIKREIEWLLKEQKHLKNDLKAKKEALKDAKNVDTNAQRNRGKSE